MDNTMPTNATINRSPDVQEARTTLRNKGYSHYSGAEALGITRCHLTFVLNGRRESRRVLEGIKNLPQNPTPA